MKLDPGAAALIARLESAGFEAYAVGGCVRDRLLGKDPHDWDLCTSALPEEVKSCMAGLPVLETGIRHGTVTVLVDHTPYEITTFRVEEGYSDHRRPDGVRFVRDLREDLRRRDFTVNAMAYAPRTGLQDPFDGQGDLRRGVLRCVGDPVERFTEDALRILRALRFSAVLAFPIEPATAAAVRQLAPTLSAVSPERIWQELLKLLTGADAPRILTGYPDVLGVFLPEVLPCVGFDQHNPYHDKTVWDHTVAAVAAAPRADRVLRLALLLHDVGKPPSFSREESGRGHFYGHEKVSAELARAALRRLRADNKTVESVTELIARHGHPLEPRSAPLLRLLRKLGEEQTRRLITLQRCDVSAQTPAIVPERLARLDAVEALLEQLLAEERCFSLKDLAVTGRDLMALGYGPGPALGAALKALLEEVIDGRLPNEPDALLAHAKKLQKK